MLDNLRMIDRQLNEAAQPLAADGAAIVQMSLDDDPFGGGLLSRLTGRYGKCGTRDCYKDDDGDSVMSERLPSGLRRHRCGPVRWFRLWSCLRLWLTRLLCRPRWTLRA